MTIKENIVTKAIFDKYHQDLMAHLHVDVAIVGAGPAGLTAGYFLSKNGIKTAIFEKALKPGGGMWGGGIMFNHIVIQDEAKYLLNELEIDYEKYQDGYLTADAVEAASTLISKTCKAGTKVFNLMGAEDVLLDPVSEKVKGVVLNWASVELSNLHVDPVAIEAKYVVDGTGHDTEVVNTLQQRNKVKLSTEDGKLHGERSLSSEKAEKDTVENTREVYPGLYVTGMACNATYGSFRMGPIFGGMLMSGEKVALEIIKNLEK